MKFSLKTLLLLLLTLLLTYNISYADINTIKQSLNKNIITTSEIDLPKNLQPINTKIILPKQQTINTAKTPKKSAIVPQLPEKASESSIIIPKLIKIKVNGIYKVIQIPYVNTQYIKNHKPLTSPKRIKDKKNPVKTAPLRIGESVSINKEDEYTVPYPINSFNFPADEKDEKRKEGIKKISELFDMINSLTTENYGNTISKIYKLAYEEIFPNYSNYPDLCMITRLYLIESGYKISKQYLNSGSQTAYQYEQLKKDYEFYKNYNGVYDKILNVINARKAEMKENDKKILQSIEKSYSEIAKRNAIIEESKKEVHSNNDESTILSYVQGVATDHSIILNNYDNIYMNYMSIGDYEKAHSIFDCKIEDDKLIMSGKFFDEYKKIPYETPFKYNKYISGTGYTGTKEIMVKQIKNAESILRMTEIYRKFEAQNAQNFDKQDFNDNDNAFQKKITKCCDYLNDPQFDTSGSPPSNAAEVIDPQKLAEFKKNAYGFSTQPGFENYFKNEPTITKLYFVRVESTELTANDIPLPTDQIILRAEIDYYKTKCPFYSFKIQINSAILNRNKTIVMKYDQNLGGYYGLFIPNETDDPTDEKKNLINNKKDEFKESIACFNGEKPFNNELLTFYNTNPYFSKNDKRNIFGYSMRDDSQFDEKKVIIKNTASFLKSGGAEYITTENNGLKAVALIKHQADWFIVDAHGWIKKESGGLGGIIEDSLEGQLVDYVHVNPEEIYNNGKSLYAENIDVLVLSSCGCLKWVGDDTNAIVFAMGWHRILPNGIILGYNEEVSYKLAKDALDDFISRFNTTGVSSTDEITLMWINSNVKKYEEFVNQEHAEYGDSAQKHHKKTVYIVGKEYFYVNDCKVIKKDRFDPLLSKIS